MSEYYQHYLIPTSPAFRPEVDLLSQFLRELIEAGFVSNSYSLSFSSVTKSDSPSREMTNPFTGETISMKGPSRQLGRAQTLETVESLRGFAESTAEYDISVRGEGIPPRPPLKVGYVQETSWKPMQDAYHQEIRCRVRSHTVCLSQLRSEDDLHRPLDLANPPSPIFDEDCDTDETEGIFVHPDAGAIRIANAGCGMFWIEFNYGKFVFPQLQGGGVDLLDDGVVTHAKSTFRTDFVQACGWG